MSKIKIQGGTKVSGKLTPSGNKNSVLPILCATLLTDDDVVIENVPELTDVAKVIEILTKLGAKLDWDKKTKSLKINNSQTSLTEYDNQLPLGMRAALLLIAPMLSRFKKITLNLEVGGCTLGIREIDPHIESLKSLGATFTQKKAKIFDLEVENFTGAELWPDYASVTGTETIIMAAVLGRGTTVLNNAAAEPHVQDLCNMLNQMGAKISGVGSSQLIIEGVEKLSGTKFKVSSDHHEITTFLALGAMTGGRVEVRDAIPEHFPLIQRTFSKLGVEVKYEGNTAIVEENQSFEPEVPFTENYIPRIEAAPWPYFPVDLLPLMIALAQKTKGTTRFWNKVYEGGLFWTPELVKFGSKIIFSDPHRVAILGPADLKGAQIDCPNIIRATVALMMTAMAAEGTSVLTNISSIYRAHPNFIENLTEMGAKIEKLPETNGAS